MQQHRQSNRQKERLAERGSTRVSSSRRGAFAHSGLAILASLSISLISIPASSQQGGVVESQGFTPGQGSSVSSRPAATTVTAPVNSDALSLLLDQNQRLQTEIQALRGLVEEQGFELRKLQRDSLNRYTSTDERLSNLENASPATSAANSAGAAIPSNVPPSRIPPLQLDPSRSSAGTSAPSGLAASNSNSRSGASSNAPVAASANTAPVSGRPAARGTLQPAVLSEQQLYQIAYDSVINSNFERSIAEFDQYLSVYPAGRFITNALYWKGQAYLYLSRYQQARDSYQVILDDYEDSPKLPDAMYGLGLAYEGLGDIRRAKQLMTDIKRRFPNTGVANLADTRLLSLD